MTNFLSGITELPLMDVLFINSSLQFSRYIKREKALVKEGLYAFVIGYSRDDYTSERVPIETIHLGNVTGGNYFRRILQFLCDSIKVHKYVKKVSVIYAFGLDMAFFTRLITSFILSKPKIIYEIGDVRQVMVRNDLVGKIGRIIEAWVLKNTSLLVLTSDAYYDEYYKKYYNIESNQIFIIENKLVKDEFHLGNTEQNQKINNDIITIGYFGRLRCQKSWEALKLLSINADNKIKIILRGVNAGIRNFKMEVEEFENITYLGPYVSPIDLPKMYNEIDIVWAAHIHSPTNTRWARSCRFYESSCFMKPMIVQKDTYDAKIANQYGIGFSIDLQNQEETIKKILQLNRDDILNYKKRFESIPESVYFYTDEHKILAQKIKDYCNEFN
jgi:succinoglycan biosynthesis protein ExoL